MELSDTLAALAESLVAPADIGVTITEAELSIPLEVRPAMQDGRMVFLAQPAHSRWRSGFTTTAHLTHVRISLEDTDGG